VSKVKRLIKSYGKYIAIPWRADAAAAQRVIFCVYDESDELRLRSRIDEFEIATKQNRHHLADKPEILPELFQKAESACHDIPKVS